MLLVVASFGASAQMTSSNAFNLGASSGSEANIQALITTIQTVTATDNIRNYNPNPAEKNQWTGAQTPLSSIISAGSAKLNACRTNNGAAGSVDSNHCEAVKSLDGTRNFNPRSIIEYNDQLIQRANGITSNPDSIAGQSPGSYSACRQETVFKQPKFSVETCGEWSEEIQNTCKVGREIIVDKDTNYVCKETLSTIARSTCYFVRQIDVDKNHRYQCIKSVSRNALNVCNDYVTPILTGAYNILSVKYPCYSQPVEVTYDTIAGVPLYRLKGMTDFMQFTGTTPWSETTYGTCWRNEGERVRIISIVALPGPTLETFCYQDNSRYGGACRNPGACCIQAYVSGISFTVEGWDAFHGVRFTWKFDVNNSGLPSTYKVEKSISSTCGAYR